MSRLDDQIRQQAEQMVAGREGMQRAERASQARARAQQGRYPAGTLAGDATRAATPDTIDVAWLTQWMADHKADRLTTSRFKLRPATRDRQFAMWGPEPYPQGKGFGYVQHDEYRPTDAAIKADVPHVLSVMQSDPEAFLAEDAIEADRCCFCAKGLQDPESRLRGWGPVCARKHGLPHGNRSGF